jgi:Zn finger protein HypA/HybF involved in hydrogenase expression
MTRKKRPVCKECKGWGIANIIDYRIDPCPKCGAGKAAKLEG